MGLILEAAAIGKRYGAVQALSDLSLGVPEGGVYGLLGPNGAGKSTLLRIAMGLVRPSRGRVTLFGERVSPASLRRVGGFIESPRFYPFLTADETLRFVAMMAALKSFDPSPLLDRVGLGGAAHRKVGGFSLGMKQRLGIASALVGAPELVILDEPTNGMDPAGIQEVRALVRQLAERDGVTVLLSSHLLDEVQRICDRVAILDKGKLSAEGSIDMLLDGGEKLRIEATPIEQVLEILGGRAEREGPAVLASISRGEAPAVISALAAAGVQIVEARWTRRDLESVFFEQTGSGQ
jgi:ABC-2 type transport system ATP-binding protein